MELAFNELSVEPLCPDKVAACKRIEQFAKTVNIASQSGFKAVRSELYTNQIWLTEHYSLYDWLVDKGASKNHQDYLFGKFIHPFIKENDEGTEMQYMEADYYFENEEHNVKKTACLGLASACLYETLCISLATKPIWNQPKLQVIIEKKDGTTSTSDVLNVSSDQSFNTKEVTEFVENIGNIILEKTTILPNEKKRHLAPHHGSAELGELCDCLQNSPYVKEMKSTDWGGRKFIRKIYKNGVIEIVLFKTQRQYALWVQTTGRNYRETKAIAEILEEKYS